MWGYRAITGKKDPTCKLCGKSPRAEGITLNEEK
jgi:hypothetical protein